MHGRWPRRWSAGGHSVVGSSHSAYHIPNQDAIAWLPRDRSADIVVIAVADGHGAPIHFRSAFGAHMAVDAALRVLGAAVAGMRDGSGSIDLSALAQSLASNWREEVRAHLSHHPLPNSEPPYPLNLDELSPYGTTLIAAAAGPAGLLALQIGDGDLLLGTTAGDMFRPLPDDIGLVGEQTYSLCQPDAASYMRAKWIDAQSLPVDFVMLSTDGLSKSFRDQQAFHRLGQFWRERIVQEGLAAATASLDEWLSKTSREGSGDDISLGFLIGDLGGAERPAVSGKADAPAPVMRSGRFRQPTQTRSRRLLSRALAIILSAAAAAAIAAGAYGVMTSHMR